MKQYAAIYCQNLFDLAAYCHKNLFDIAVYSQKNLFDLVANVFNYFSNPYVTN